jgi:hypothetical protein
MRVNLHQALKDLISAGQECDAATEAQVTKSFRKPFEIQRRIDASLASYEGIVESIKETSDYTRRLVQSIRVTKIELSEIADSLSPAFMEKERRPFERVNEYKRLTERPEESIAAPAEGAPIEIQGEV